MGIQAIDYDYTSLKSFNQPNRAVGVAYDENEGAFRLFATRDVNDAGTGLLESASFGNDVLLEIDYKNHTIFTCGDAMPSPVGVYKYNPDTLKVWQIQAFYVSADTGNDYVDTDTLRKSLVVKGNYLYLVYHDDSADEDKLAKFEYNNGIVGNKIREKVVIDEASIAVSTKNILFGTKLLDLDLNEISDIPSNYGVAFITDDIYALGLSGTIKTYSLDGTELSSHTLVAAEKDGFAFTNGYLYSVGASNTLYSFSVSALGILAPIDSDATSGSYPDGTNFLASDNNTLVYTNTLPYSIAINEGVFGTKLATPTP